MGKEPVLSATSASKVNLTSHWVVLLHLVQYVINPFSGLVYLLHTEQELNTLLSAIFVMWQLNQM